MFARVFKTIAITAGLTATILGGTQAVAKDITQAQRLVTIGSSTTELAFALGAGDRVVAVDVTSKHPQQALKLPKVGYYRSLSAEGILSMKPDVLLGTDEMGPPAIFNQLQAGKVQIEQLPAGSDVDNLKRRIELMAQMFEQPQAGQDLWIKIDNQLKAAAKMAEGKRPRVLFMLSHTGTPMMGGGDTEIDTLITLAGGINVAAEYFDSYRQVSAESLLTMQPDILIVSASSLADKSVEQLLSVQPGLAATPAGINKRVEVVDGTLLIGGLGPRTGEAVLELARKFYPASPSLMTVQAN
ncbi:heme/hemin ABC transporter substrate-binding protein [Spongorhabdus nitratireducens]